VGLEPEVHQQLCVGVGPKWFAQVLATFSQEGTTLCSGKALSGETEEVFRSFVLITVSWRG